MLRVTRISLVPVNYTLAINFKVQVVKVGVAAVF